MSLRGKYSLWIMAFLLALALFFVIPVASKSSLFDFAEEWLTEYEQAIENAQDDDDDDDADSTDAVALMQVRIDDEISEYAGIAFHELTTITFFPEFKAYAEVVDLRPMLNLRSRYQQTASAVRVANVALQSAKQELSRLNLLAKSTGSIASKKVVYAQAAQNEASAKLAGLQIELQAINDEAVQSWGETITGWLLKNDSTEWQRLLKNKDSLLLVTLAADNSLPSETSFIRVSRDGQRDHARKSYYVSSALTTDKLFQGETYFFKTATGKLRTGMRLDAWIAEGDESLQGVFIPEQAIVWHQGQAWVYIEIDENLYQRKPVKNSLVTAGGVFMQQELVVGDALVIDGAQMLLSEEFKWQIADEDDD